MSYGGRRALAGAFRGLSEGLAAREDKRLRRKDIALREQRDTRAAQAHELDMKKGELDIEAAEAKAAHDDYLREHDAVMRRFVATDGVAYEGLQALYNEAYPDGGRVQIERSPEGTFTLDFGDGRVLEDLDTEQVAGLASRLRDPGLYLEELRKNKQREAEQTRGIEKEERGHKRDIELKGIEHKHRMKAREAEQAGGIEKEERGYKRDIKLKGIEHKHRMAERKPEKGELKVGDDGRLYRIKDGKATPVEGPTGGLTFRGERGDAKTTAKLREVDAYYKRLKPVTGENDEQRWIRAWAEVAKKGRESPEKYRMGLFNKVYEQVIKNESSIFSQMVKNKSSVGNRDSETSPDEVSETSPEEVATAAAEAAVREFDRYFGVGDNGKADRPLVPGARKAADGNWYVQQNGQWMIVEP